MGKIRQPHLVKLVIGFIFKADIFLERVKAILEKRFGRIDFESQTISFNHTDYYEKELGFRLQRKFISFRKLIRPEELPRIKTITNKLEKKLSAQQRRLINIDPGYLDAAKLILASTKDYKHRIYLTKGIYSEITLFYEKGTFRPWKWTYPDYQTQAYISLFNHIREIYKAQI